MFQFLCAPANKICFFIYPAIFSVSRLLQFSCDRLVLLPPAFVWLLRVLAGEEGAFCFRSLLHIGEKQYNMLGYISTRKKQLLF